MQCSRCEKYALRFVCETCFRKGNPIVDSTENSAELHQKLEIIEKICDIRAQCHQLSKSIDNFPSSAQPYSITPFPTLDHDALGFNQLKISNRSQFLNGFTQKIEKYRQLIHPLLLTHHTLTVGLLQEVRLTPAFLPNESLSTQMKIELTNFIDQKKLQTTTHTHPIHILRGALYILDLFVSGLENICCIPTPFGIPSRQWIYGPSRKENFETRLYLSLCHRLHHISSLRSKSPLPLNLGPETTLFTLISRVFEELKEGKLGRFIVTYDTRSLDQ